MQIGEDEAHGVLGRGRSGGNGGIACWIMYAGSTGRGGGAVGERGGWPGRGDGLVEVLLDGGGGPAAAGAKVDKDVVADRGGEVAGKEAGGELGGRGSLEEGNLTLVG